MSQTHEQSASNSRPIITDRGDLRLPVQLGHYRVYKKLGEGGMGQVYLAEDKALNRQVAIKTLAQRLVAQPSYVRRFLNEARSIAQLSHPGLIQIYYIGRVGAVVFFAMEYAPGETVSARLKRVGRLAPDEALSIARQVAEALGGALEQGIIHRDIKPANLFIDSRGRVKVGDFGLAKSRNQDMSLTQAGSVMGSPYYISPEQGCGHAVDHRSDIYSLGATLYHMMAGRPPFAAPSAVEMVMRHLKDPLPPLEGLPPEWSEPINALLGRMMAKKPDDRHASYEALIEDLGAARAQAGLPASVPVPAPADAEISSPVAHDSDVSESAAQTDSVARPRRRWARIGLAAGLLVAASVVFAVAWRQMRSADEAQNSQASMASNGQSQNPPGPTPLPPDEDALEPGSDGALTTAAIAGATSNTTITTSSMAAIGNEGAGGAEALGSAIAAEGGRLPRHRDRQVQLLKEHFHDHLAGYQFMALDVRIEEYLRLARTAEQMAALRQLRFQIAQLIDLKHAMTDRINQARGTLTLEVGPQTTLVFLRADAAFLRCRVVRPDGVSDQSRPWGELLAPEQFLRLGWDVLPASPFKINALWTFASVYEIEDAYEALWEDAGVGAPERPMPEE